MRPYIWTKGFTPPEDRIMRKLFETHGPLAPDACWIWPGATCGRKPHYYGAIKVGSRQNGTRRNRMTHVVMWEAVNGPTPEGKELVPSKREIVEHLRSHGGR